MCIVRFGDPVFHIAEVQIVHDDMMAVRRNMGAHNEYNEFRAIQEIFQGRCELCTGLVHKPT